MEADPDPPMDTHDNNQRSISGKHQPASNGHIATDQFLDPKPPPNKRSGQTKSGTKSHVKAVESFQNMRRPAVRYCQPGNAIAQPEEGDQSFEKGSIKDKGTRVISRALEVSVIANHLCRPLHTLCGLYGMSGVVESSTESGSGPVR